MDDLRALRELDTKFIMIVWALLSILFVVGFALVYLTLSISGAIMVFSRLGSFIVQDLLLLILTTVVWSILAGVLFILFRTRLIFPDRSEKA